MKGFVNRFQIAEAYKAVYMPTSDAISRVLLVLILALVLSLITASQAYEQEVMQCKM